MTPCKNIWLNHNPVTFAFNGTSCGFNWRPRAVGPIRVSQSRAGSDPSCTGISSATGPMSGLAYGNLLWCAWMQILTGKQKEKSKTNITEIPSLRKAAKAENRVLWGVYYHIYAQPTLLRVSLVVACKGTIACVVCSASRSPWCTHACTHTQTHGSVCVTFNFAIGWKSNILQDGCAFVHQPWKKTSVVPFQLFWVFFFFFPQSDSALSVLIEVVKRSSGFQRDFTHK